MLWATNSPSPIRRFRTRWSNEQRAEMEVNRRFSSRVHRRWRDRRFRYRGDRSSLYVRATSAWLRGPGDEKSPALAAAIDRRTDDENLDDPRQGGLAIGRDSRRHRQTRARRDHRIASRDRAISHAGTTATFETDGRASSAMDPTAPWSVAPRGARR